MAHSIYEELTRQIIEALKKGRLPRIRPWNTWPLRHNGRRFTGTNSLILCLAGEEEGQRCRHWMSGLRGRGTAGALRVVATGNRRPSPALLSRTRAP